MMRGLTIASMHLLKKGMAISILATALFIILYYLASCMGDVDRSYVAFIAAASLSSAFSVTMLSISKWIETGWVKFISSTFGNYRAINNPIVAALFVPILTNCLLLLAYALIEPRVSSYMISGMLITILSLSLLAACSFSLYSHSRSPSSFESAAVASPVLGVAVIFAHVFRIIVPDDHLLWILIATAAVSMTTVVIISRCRFDSCSMRGDAR